MLAVRFVTRGGDLLQFRAGGAFASAKYGLFLRAGALREQDGERLALGVQLRDGSAGRGVGRRVETGGAGARGDIGEGSRPFVADARDLLAPVAEPRRD